MIISSPFLLRIITKDEEIAVEAVDAAQTEKEKEIEKEKETTPTTTNAKIDKTQAVRRSDISLMIEVIKSYYQCQIESSKLENSDSNVFHFHPFFLFVRTVQMNI